MVSGPSPSPSSSSSSSPSSSSTTAPSKPSPAFLRHLSYFAAKPSRPHLITFPSALRSSLALGLNFPVSCLLSLALRVLYSTSPSPLPLPLAPVDLRKLKTNRTQLEQFDELEEHEEKSSSSSSSSSSKPTSSSSGGGGGGGRGSYYSRAQLLAMVPQRGSGGGAGAGDRSSLSSWLGGDRAHVFGLWALAADPRSGAVSRADVDAFRRGEMLERLAERRRRGRADVLPFRRGGPIGVGGHSWAVKRLFGVTVYEKT